MHINKHIFSFPPLAFAHKNASALDKIRTVVRFFTIKGTWLKNGDCALENFNEIIPYGQIHPGVHAHPFLPAADSQAVSTDTPLLFSCVRQMHQNSHTVVEDSRDTQNLQLAYAGTVLDPQPSIELDPFGLTHHPTLGLKDMGATALAAGLTVNCSIHTINLAGNNIGEVGARALGEGLAHNSQVLTLVLDNNVLGNSGAKAVLQGLIGNRALEELRLDSNGIDDEGVPDMMSRLHKNYAIRTLSLAFNSVRRISRARLKAAMIHNHPRAKYISFEVL